MSVPIIHIVSLAAASSLIAGDASTMLWYDAPASRFYESAPLGNGRIGAMVFGGVDEDRIVLNESSVWSGSPQNADREGASAALPEIRRLLREGKNPEAEALVNQHFTCVPPGSGGGNGANVRFGCYQVLGNLRIRSGHGPVWSSPSGHAGQAGQGITQSTDGDPKTKWCFEHGGASCNGRWNCQKMRSPRAIISPRRTTCRNATPSSGNWRDRAMAKPGWSSTNAMAKSHLPRASESKSYEIAKPGSCRFFRFTFPTQPRRAAFPTGGDRSRWGDGEGPAHRIPPHAWICKTPSPASVISSTA